MEVTVTLDQQKKPVKTLADLDDFVAAKVHCPGSTIGVVRWRHHRDVLGPQDGMSGPIGCFSRDPGDYEVMEIIGKPTMTFHD